MESPFFTNRRWYQQPDPTYRPFHPSVRGVPVCDVDPTPAPHRPVQRPAERASVPKVVRIPVQFFGSQQLDRTGAAVKIQKVFRGFSVRKNMRKIKDIKVQVDEIEEKLKKDEVVDLVKSDPKERLRMNESLMALLLKLDSISGVDFGVRLCRKSVIRQAIGLQERIDAIVAADLDAKGESVDLEIEVADNSVPPLNSKDSCENESNDDEDGIVDVGVDCEVKVSENGEIAKEEEGNESKSNREMLEKMMKGNEKMMSMMNQLFERSEMQTRMLNGLTHRVELLEKAVVCDRLRKKKKVKSAAAACRDN